MEKNRCSLGKFYIFVEFSGVTAALIILNVLCRLSVMESGISKFSRTLRAQITPKVSQNLKNGKVLKNLGIWVKNGKLSKVSHFFWERNELVKGMVGFLLYHNQSIKKLKSLPKTHKRENNHSGRESQNSVNRKTTNECCCRR